MKNKPALGALCLLAATLPCVADTFLLKDGTTLNGAIVSEAGDSYILEVQVTKSIKEEDTLIEARYKAEKDAKQNWVTISPFHKPSLEDTVKLCEQELVRLGAVQTVLGVDGGKAYRDAWTAVQGGNAAAAASAPAAAKTAAVPARYLAPLEAAAKNIK